MVLPTFLSLRPKEARSEVRAPDRFAQALIAIFRAILLHSPGDAEPKDFV